MVALMQTLAQAVCPVHGEYQYLPRSKRGTPVEAVCPKCRQEELEKEALSAPVVDLQRELELRARAKAAGIPDRFVGMSFSNYETPTENQTKLLRAAKRYTEKFSEIKAAGYGMVLLGDYGTGKTLTASLIAKGVIERSYRVVYTEQHLMAVHIRDERRLRHREKDAINTFAATDLLIVDELGRFCDDEARNLLGLVLAQRYNRSLPTILLGNMDKKDMTEYLTDMVVLRLTELGCYMQMCEWPPMRKPLAASIL